MFESNQQTNLFKAFPLSSLLLLPDAPNFTITDVNTAYIKAIHTDASELVGKSIFEVFPYHPLNISGDGIDLLQQSLRTVLHTGKSHKMAIRKYLIPVMGTDKTIVKYWEPENIPVLDENNKVSCIIHSIQDITEQQMSLLINNTEESFILLDEKLHIISCNKKSHVLFKEILGVEVHTGDYILDYARPERKAIVKERYNRILGGATEISEINLPVKDGSNKHFSIRYTPAKDQNSLIVGVFITVHDITEHKELQNKQQELLTELTQRNAFIEAIIQNVPIGIAVNKIDEGTAILINKYFIETYGWNQDELSDVASFFTNVYPDENYRNEIMNRVITDIESGDPERMNWQGISITTASGKKKIINSKNIPLFDQNLMISTAIDVTESTRHTAEINRIKTNQESLINGTEDLIWSLDTNLCLITANKAYLQMIQSVTNRIPAEGDSVFVEPFGEDLNKKWKNYYNRALKGEKFSIREEVYDPLKQSTVYGLISLNPMYTSGGELFGIACYSKDITEENLQLQALEKAKNELNKIMNSSPDIICTIDEAGNFIKVNAAAKNIWGYQPEELIGKPFMQFVYAEDHQKTNKASLEIMDGTDMTNFENRYIKKDGSLVPMVWSARWDAKEKINYCVARDATEKLKNESALIESEKKYKYLFDNNPMPMVIWDFETKKIIDCNEEALLKYGYTRDEYLQLTIKDIRPQEDVSLIEEATQTEVIYGNIHKRVWRHKKKNGELMFMDIDGHLIDYNGRRASLVMLNDITEKVKAEKEIIESNQRYQFVTKATSHAIWDWNLITDKVYWGEGFEFLFGYTSQDFTFDINAWIKYVHPEDCDRVVKGIYALIDSSENNWIDEYRFQKKDQTYAYVIDKGFVIRDEQGKAIRMVGAMQDITKQKQEEQHLKLLESVITNARDAIIITDASPLDGEGPLILYVNDSFTEMTGYSREEVIGKSPRFLQGPKSDRKKLDILRDALEKWKPCTIEIINYRKNGEAFWINMSIVPVANEKGWFTHWISVERDVTERKIAEETLNEKNLELKKLSSYLQNVREQERKYIAREVHDELGQLASALKIDIDWLSIKIVALEENAKNRIAHANKTIEVLISSIRKIASSLRPSILDDFGLNAALKWHCAEFQNLNGIQCLFEPGFDDKILSMDQKTELYRIVQESLTNVMRHAKASSVSVVTREDTNCLYLTIADNGRGFDISQRKNTLGLIGLRERAISLKGEMHIETVVGVGTTISAVIPKNSEQ